MCTLLIFKKFDFYYKINIDFNIKTTTPLLVTNTDTGRKGMFLKAYNAN